MWTCPRLKEMMKSALPMPTPHYPLSSVVPKRTFTPYSTSPWRTLLKPASLSFQCWRGPCEPPPPKGASLTRWATENHHGAALQSARRRVFATACPSSTNIILLRSPVHPITANFFVRHTGRPRREPEEAVLVHHRPGYRGRLRSVRAAIPGQPGPAQLHVLLPGSRDRILRCRRAGRTPAARALRGAYRLSRAQVNGVT